MIFPGYHIQGNQLKLVKLNKVTTSRGNQLKLMKERPKYDLKKFTFTNRVNNIWNSLPNNIIMSLTTNQFKNSLDKFWINQEVRYNYDAELSGIGSRSENSTRV